MTAKFQRRMNFAALDRIWSALEQHSGIHLVSHTEAFLISSKSRMETTEQ